MSRTKFRGSKRGRGRGGYNGGKRGGGQRGGNRGGGRDWNQAPRQSHDEINKTNEKFERYYNGLNIVPEGPEREAFWAALRRELPNAFRFCGSKGHALAVRKNMIEHYIPIIKTVKHEGKNVTPPEPLPWYPDGLAYSMTTPKNVVRKYEPFKDFQKFLVSETSVGNISRQEQVSMIPPLLLDVQPHHTVLDLCAAPGSKSAQLAELIHAGEEDRVANAIQKPSSDGVSDPTSDDGRSTGLLIANDVNYTRAQMLVHQVKRLNSPNLIVMNHDATMFPSIELPTDRSPNEKKAGKFLKFDRILADVPCSGDGTVRKSPNIWNDWNPANGLGLYITQVRILVRSLQMLKVGGKVVYSTCSLNPIENEAVVASAIERCGGNEKVRLLDQTGMLPGLKRNPGLKKWSIMNKDGTVFDSWQPAGGPGTDKIVEGMFSPPEEMHLDRCLRLLPHQQDTGGFFVAVLEKMSEIKAKPEIECRCMNADKDVVIPGGKPSIIDIATDMELGSDGLAHSEALDQLDPTGPIDPNELDGGNAPAAARQNKANPGEVAVSPKRKAQDALADGISAVKKPKIREDEDDITMTGEEGRQEHWPLPPSVQQAKDAAGGGDQYDHVSTNGSAKETAMNSPLNSPLPTLGNARERKRARDDQPHEEAFKYLASDHAELLSIYSFYELSSRFPRDRFMVRNPVGDPVKGIYYTSDLVKSILQTNEGRGMKFVHAGVKMYMKQDAQGQDICRWRIQSEGLPIIEGWVGEVRVVRLQKKATLRKLLIEMFPKVGTGPDGGWKELGEIGEQVLNMGMGCCVLRVEPTDAEDGFTERLTLPLWRSMHSLNLMLPKEERKAMLLRVYNEDTPLIDHSQLRKQQEREQAAAAAEVKEDDEDDVKAEGGVLLPITDENAMMAEDRILADDQAAKEDDDVKIAKAMPEREGEGDELNTTV